MYLKRPWKDYVRQTTSTIHVREVLNSGDVMVFMTGQEEINGFIE
jgi:HrpA-like RNA helicase